MATVADLMVKDVLTVEPSDTIGEAAEKMNAANVGAVVVLEDMVRIVGIVTERDLLRAVASRARAAEARVRQWMTSDPVTIEPQTSIEDADWPGLAKKDRFEGRDLRITTDLRAVLKGLLADHLQVAHSHLNGDVFPRSDAVRGISLLS